MLVSEAFSLPENSCNACKAPCEKACRRGSVDRAVSIRDIIRKVAAMSFSTCVNRELSNAETDRYTFQSRLGRFSTGEKERLMRTVYTPSRCLHCACSGRAKCKLRAYATAYGIKRPRYESSSALPVMSKQSVSENLWFEPAKCIRCGLCVYNSKNGFTFRDRGFGMSVILPEENRENVGEKLAALCPTGAIWGNDE